jgi:threonine aldolase
MLAAAAIHALDNHVQRLADDHLAARTFAEAVADRAPEAIGLDSVETNIVVLNTGATPAPSVAAAAAKRGVLVSALGSSTLRGVTHLDVSVADCARAGEVVGDMLRGVP